MIKERALRWYADNHGVTVTDKELSEYLDDFLRMQKTVTNMSSIRRQLRRWGQVLKMSY